MRRVLIGLVVVGATGLAACGGKGGGAATVTGTVTLPDGSPLPGGRVDFRASASGAMAGSAVLKSDGTYELPDVPAGEYKVAVVNGHMRSTGQAPAGADAASGADKGQKYVPINAKYAQPDTSTLTTTVAGKTHTFNIKLDK